MTSHSRIPGVIEIDHMWKRFRADRSRPVLRDEAARLAGIFKKGDDSRRWRWALRDLEVRIDQGESVGLFGANGSGKSTLLKILTRVMYPTAGSLGIGGRVGALIEVKAGVHPDLTGRENIYLYGSLMGLKRPEIEKKFDEIVDFAELSQALDRQLKFYSSGMAMRLGFAVAAFLQPDILLVDEVLAVGDSAFQQRCLDRMRAVLQEGTTLVFVSHDLASIESISKRGLWLRNGEVEADGPIRESISAYRHHIESAAEQSGLDGGSVAVSATVAGPGGTSPASEEPVHIDLSFTSVQSGPAVLFLGVSEGPAAPVFSLRREIELAAGEVHAACKIASLPLPRGRYFLWVAITDTTGADMTPWHPATMFDVQGAELDPVLPGVMRLSPVHVSAQWEIGSTPGKSPMSHAARG